jgi:hypothetical protein
MSNYYFLNNIVSTNEYFAERVDLSDETVSDLYLDGVSLKDKSFTITLKKLSIPRVKLTVRNIIANAYGFVIVSQPIADVLKVHCAGEIELFEVKVDMPVKVKYYLINILNLKEDYIDLEKSVYEFILPERPDILIFKYLEKLVLHTEKINHDIFRIKSFSNNILVSETLKEKLEELGMEEIGFQSTEEYQKGMYSKK